MFHAMPQLRQVQVQALSLFRSKHVWKGIGVPFAPGSGRDGERREAAYLHLVKGRQCKNRSWSSEWLGLCRLSEVPIPAKDFWSSQTSCRGQATARSADSWKWTIRRAWRSRWRSIHRGSLGKRVDLRILALIMFWLLGSVSVICPWVCFLSAQVLSQTDYGTLKQQWNARSFAPRKLSLHILWVMPKFGAIVIAMPCRNLWLWSLWNLASSAFSRTASWAR